MKNPTTPTDPTQICLMANMSNAAGEPIIVGTIDHDLPAGTTVLIRRGPDARPILAVAPSGTKTEPLFRFLAFYGVSDYAGEPIEIV